MKDRKRHVMLTAKELFMKNGFFATSVQDILNESGISKGTFYNYFSSKNECLIAILEKTEEETMWRRRNLLTEENKADKNILMKQIIVRLQINREQNLFPIFQAIFQSNDSDLKSFLKEQNHKELIWFSYRLMDIYGMEVKPFVIDLSIMMHGMTQSFMHAWMMSTKEELDSERLVQFTMDKLDAIVHQTLKEQKVFLNKNLFLSKSPLTEDQGTLTKQELLEQFRELLNQVNDDKTPSNQEHILFIIEELQGDEPRLFLLETVALSLQQSFQKTNSESIVSIISARLWDYIEMQKKIAML